MGNNIILKAVNITKIFPGVTALNNVNFDIREGEIHSLVGENGSGKSTLIKIISGVYQPTSGEIYISGQKVDHLNPIKAKELGISVVHQELSLINTQSVVESFYYPQITLSNGFLNWKKMKRDISQFLKDLNIEINIEEKVGRLPIGKKQLLEIARAVYYNSKVILLDEPTSSLSENEIWKLFEIISKLKTKQVSIVYISHKINEVLEISDRITVLKDGRITNQMKKEEASVEKIISSMVGKTLNFKYSNPEELQKIKNSRPHFKDKKILLKFENISNKKDLKNISLEVRKGEIHGFFGVIGSGRTETIKSVLGINDLKSGKIIFEDKEVRFRSPYSALKNGIAYATENRREEGLIFTFDFKSNISLVKFNKEDRKFIDFNLEKSLANEAIKKFEIKIPSVSSGVRELSGGNQQKVVISKYFLSHPKLLILDEPTKGIDVGAKEEIYRFIFDLANSGITVILISSELPEIMMLCDRVTIFKSGKTISTFNLNEVTEEDILKSATA
ncbi:sugar ABC transporter ATP-binding protein [Petrotoga sp. 9PWA.NaAc.5.4]|uniref:sugar ABC transporter ATP-binding protein n=1 Tax=Petrotoga sp. 9PWA.NaAc.5.4 TaxID=1434328 RepID=UPI000CAED1C9|nr:sugar ABC transporter ATP-binding protein [Petrotoga sp. 9PWA.NaAc.5.4]PNR96610.1 ribose ABC transporter [Petrotoga sp. 9PWA.NaAc.5.4]